MMGTKKVSYFKLPLPFKAVFFLHGKLFIYFKDFIYFYREGKGGEGQKHQCVVTSCAPPTGDVADLPGMCRRLGIRLATL